MIEDPPLLTIRREIARPERDQVAALKGVATSLLVDLLGGAGALDQAIKPIGQADGLPHGFCGPAVTAACGPSDNLAVFAALALAEPGDVIVAGTEGFLGAAVVGDLVLGMARNRAAAGFVTDGLVRDYTGILDVGLPVACRGISPNSPARSGPGSVNQPLAIGGLVVEPGDLVAGDRDGVVVVPRARVAEVIAGLPALLAAEADLLAKVEAGLGVPDYIEALLGSDKVRYLD